MASVSVPSTATTRRAPDKIRQFEKLIPSVATAAFANDETHDGLIEYLFWTKPKPTPAPISNPFTVLGLLRRLFDVRFDY